MEILIARHGQDEDNVRNILNGHRDMPLTKLGEEQARKAGEMLKRDNASIDVILCSPLKRAHKTAEIISQIVDGPNPKVDKLLIERDFGILTGKPISDIPKYATETLQTDVVNYFITAEGSEDFPTLYKRAQKVLEELRIKYPNNAVLLVCHGDIGKMIRAAYHGWTWKEGITTPYFDNSEVLKLEPTKDELA